MLSIMIELHLDALPPNVLAGTSSWSAADWEGVFYPSGTRAPDFITEYAKHLPTVEIDSSFYHAPSAQTVDSWNRKTPAGFVFAAKMPQAITHEKALVECADDTARFLEAMSRLGSKLGPIVLQFAYVAKGKDEGEYRTGAQFRRRLEAFLRELPRGFRFAVEIRNATWLDSDFLALLRSHEVALVLSDYYTMPTLAAIERDLDPLTADFSVVRFLGNRKQMDDLIARKKKEDGKQREFDEVIVDRTPEMRRWVPALKRLAPRASRLFLYFNNHYAGFGPGSVALFAKTWTETTGAEEEGGPF